jgi:hypothetical protein
MRIASPNNTHKPERGSRAFESVIKFLHSGFPIRTREILDLGSGIINTMGDWGALVRAYRAALKGIVRDLAHAKHQ